APDDSGDGPGDQGAVEGGRSCLEVPRASPYVWTPCRTRLGRRCTSGWSGRVSGAGAPGQGHRPRRDSQSRGDWVRGTRGGGADATSARGVALADASLDAMALGVVLPVFALDVTRPAWDGPCDHGGSGILRRLRWASSRLSESLRQAH